ncbi:hypothetical protein C8F04DRAFT_1175830 [Mycena alexandri]|uniref:Uncharacterized protein n=1 Tax=Mycena alexandri TaxID=1745969 RepID=A0AAD6XC91_9AGAR|nr:hypothetical protein C8F04DRAFT_1175830 [Mycena alexandri]
MSVFQMGPGKKPWRGVPAVAVLACPGVRLTQSGALDRVVAAYSHCSTAQRQHSTHGRIAGLLDVRYYRYFTHIPPRKFTTLSQADPLNRGCLRRPREVFNNLVQSPGSSSRQSFRP